MKSSRTDAEGVLTIVIPGKPIGKPRWQKPDKWKPRKCIVDYRAWCDLVRLIAKPIPSAGSVLGVNVRANFKVPSSWSKKKQDAMVRHCHRQVPDCDNVLKSVLDALWPKSKKIATGGKGDDSEIAWVQVVKWWAGESYVEIRITHEVSQ